MIIRIGIESPFDLEIQSPTLVQDRGRLCSPSLIHFDSLTGVLQFTTYCSGSRNTWLQTIVFDDWDAIVDEELRIENTPWETIKAEVPSIHAMGARVHCNCPAFQYWGSWYNLEQRDTALFPEGMPPPVYHDPQFQNIICKHLAAVIAQYF